VHAQDLNEIEDNEGLVGVQTMLAGNVSPGKISSLAAEFSPFTSLISSIFLRQEVEIHFLQSCFNLQYENGAKAYSSA